MKAIRIWLGIALVLPAIVLWVAGLTLIMFAALIAGEPEWFDSARGKGAKKKQWKDV